MKNERKYKKVEDPTNVLFKEAIGHKVVIPFKVQVKFYIPLFERKIDANSLEKWLSLVGNYCFVK